MPRGHAHHCHHCHTDWDCKTRCALPAHAACLPCALLSAVPAKKSDFVEGRRFRFVDKDGEVRVGRYTRSGYVFEGEAVLTVPKSPRNVRSVRVAVSACCVVVDGEP